MIQRRELLASSLGVAMLSAVGLAQAQPTKTVRIVVPFASGGVQDTLARALSQEMGMALGQTVIVENRAGAGGTVGTGYVARAEADGSVMVAAAADYYRSQPVACVLLLAGAFTADANAVAPSAPVNSLAECRTISITAPRLRANESFWTTPMSNSIPLRYWRSMVTFSV